MAIRPGRLTDHRVVILAIAIMLRLTRRQEIVQINAVAAKVRTVGNKVKRVPLVLSAMRPSSAQRPINVSVGNIL